MTKAAEEVFERLRSRPAIYSYTLSIDGSIKPEDSADLGFEIGGTIAKLPCCGRRFRTGRRGFGVYANATDLQAPVPAIAGFGGERAIGTEPRPGAWVTKLMSN